MMVNTRQGKTIRRIREAVQSGKLPKEFTPADVNEKIGIQWAGVFLPKHRKDNPGGNTVLFIRISSRPARYKLFTS